MIEMLRQGFGLLDYRDPTLTTLVEHTVRVAFWATLIALVAGLPIAYWIASGNSRARRIGRIVANAGLGLPPVGVGVYWVLMAPPHLPFLTGYDLLAQVQAVLSLPIIVALCATAFSSLPGGLVVQARAFGASGWRLALFTLREAKVGVVTAVIVALGAAIGEVGAITIVMVGGGLSPEGTLATKMLYIAAGGDGDAFLVELAIVLVGMLLLLGGLLTVVQQWSGLPRRLLPARPLVAREARS